MPADGRRDLNRRLKG